MAKTNKPVDSTAAQRTANMKERLQAGGGARMSLNLEGRLVKKLDNLVKAGLGRDRSDVIRRLIGEQ